MIPEDQNDYPDWLASEAGEWRRQERFERAMDIAAEETRRQDCEEE